MAYRNGMELRKAGGKSNQDTLYYMNEPVNKLTNKQIK